MEIQNNGKARVLKVALKDCVDDAAKVLWYTMYKAQKKDDILRRNMRLRATAKFREVPAPRWKPDTALRVVIGKGRTIVLEAFRPAAEKALVGEIEVGRMAISTPDKTPTVPDITPDKTPKKAQKVAKRKDTADAKERWTPRLEDEVA